MHQDDRFVLRWRWVSVEPDRRRPRAGQEAFDGNVQRSGPCSVRLCSWTATRRWRRPGRRSRRPPPRVHGSWTFPKPISPPICADRLSAAAREAGVYVVMGLNEVNSEARGASLYNSMLYVGPDGRILGKHRKLVPTAPERMGWLQGQGEYLEVYDIELGKLGGLICWENYMPLARYAMYAWGVEVYSTVQ